MNPVLHPCHVPDANNRYHTLGDQLHPVGNGLGRCGVWGLRAPARCITVPRGTYRGTKEASNLKLKLVR